PMKMKNKWTGIILGITGSLALCGGVQATNANLTIRYQDTIAFSGNVEMPSSTTFSYTAGGLNSTTTTAEQNVLTALLAADAISDRFAVNDIVYTPGLNDYYLNCLDITASSTVPACGNWQYVVNGQYPAIGIGNFLINGGEQITFYFGDRYRIGSAKAEYYVNEIVTTTLESYDYTTNAWHGLADSSLLATTPILPDFSNWPPTTIISTTTDAAGVASLAFSATGSYYLTLPNEYYPGKIITVTSTPLSPNSTTVTTTRLFVRYEDRLLFQGAIPFSGSVIFNYHDNGTAIATTTATTTVLTALTAADELDDAWDITKLDYYPGFAAFYLDCLTIHTPSSTRACGQWNYTVNGQYPSIGMSSFPLAGSETVSVFFHQPWQVTASTTTMPIGATTTIQTWRYDYSDLTKEWIMDPLTALDIAVPNPNPTNPWETTLTVTTTRTNMSGSIDYSFATTGTFYVGIAASEFPKGVGSGGTTLTTFNVSAAEAFLSSNQSSDGAIGRFFYDDWAAIALGAVNRTGAAATKLRDYLRADPTPLVTGSPQTDYERRAMGLMALGVNPYDGTATNYIERILAGFDGISQFGDASRVNDDIFAIFPLLNAGISSTDPRIVSSTKFILQNQTTDGSWGGADLTAAAIQALKLVESVSGVPATIEKGKQYLRVKQQNDGSIDGNVPATSWGKQAFAALGEEIRNDYLAGQQAADGGMLGATETLSNRLWATSYALPAVLNKTWDNILQNFNPPSTVNQSPISASQKPTTISTTTITTSSVSTSTPSSSPAIKNNPIEIPTTTIVNNISSEESEAQHAPIQPPPRLINPAPPARKTPPSEPPTNTNSVSTTTETTSNTGASGPSTQNLSVPGNTIPLSSGARRVFAVSASVTGGLGLYLAWRFLQTLV
ncbi:MAG: hypothetical protein HY984_01075, partial [Candidatus Magasanikbacteria bacterium]|nr:hypothetical protein [Candidatus Magasanikbacteria bacterium]